MANSPGAILRAFKRAVLVAVLSVWFVSGGSISSLAADAPHVRIDRLADKAAVGPQASIVDDLTFLRRVTLDLAGRVPSIDEARSFAADPSPEKRAQAVDRLISSPEFYRHLAAVFDIMLMERRGDMHVKSVEFRGWLQQCFQQKRPYNDIVRDLLLADGTEEEQRAASAFLLEREVEPNLLTRDIGRIFLGIDLQCAQCHDHPLIADYHQADYFGIISFVNQLTVFRPDKKKPALIGETVSGQSEFKSVFTERKAVTAPRLPAEVEIVEPTYLVGDEYVVRPAKNSRPVPKFSRRDKLAELISSGKNPLFRRNIANRLWAMMMGRGLVHPVDQHHSENPPTNPELLDLLADEFANVNYDVSTMLREIALSKTYQRSWQLPSDLSPAPDAHQDVLASLIAQVDDADARVEALREEATTALERLDEVLAEARPLRTTLQKAVTAAQAEATKVDAAEATRKSNEKKYEKKQSESSAVRAVADSALVAAAVIADDKELAASARMLEAKAVKLEAEAAGLKTSLEASLKALAAAQAKLDEANKPVEAARKVLAPVEARVREKRAAHVAVREKIRSTRELAQYTQRKARFLENVVILDAAERSYSEASPQLVRIDPMSQAAQMEYAAAEKVHQDASAQMKAAAEASAASQAALADLQTQLDSFQLAADSVSGAVVAAENAQSLLGDETDLADAVAALDVIQKRIGGDLAGLQARTEMQREVAEKDQRTLATSTEAFDTAAERAARLKSRSRELASSVAKLREQVQTAKLVIDEASEKVIRKASSQFNIAVVEPLTPEQLAWSILQTTGQLERQRAAELAKLNKASPVSTEDQKDTAKVAARNQAADAAAHASLNGTVARFVTLFGGEKGQPQDAFFATVDQALFFANGGEIRSWLSPSGDNLTGRLLKLEAPDVLAEELYMSMFTRQPDDAEIAEVATYLEQREADRSAAVQEMAWALLTSVEFRFHR